MTVYQMQNKETKKRFWSSYPTHTDSTFTGVKSKAVKGMWVDGKKV